MRSEVADRYIAEINELQTPYTIELSGVELEIHEGVYPTGLMVTLFGDTILKNEMHDLKHKEILDYGTGTGFLAILMAKHGARVTAIDLNPQALECARHNIKLNEVESLVELIQSDGFSAIPEFLKFDLILAGIPWENATPQSNLEMSFYDQDFRMRKSLFNNAKNFLNPDGKILMSYSERVQLEEPIENYISGYKYSIIGEERADGQLNYIYEIIPF